MPGLYQAVLEKVQNYLFRVLVSVFVSLSMATPYTAPVAYILSLSHSYAPYTHSPTCIHVNAFIWFVPDLATLIKKKCLRAFSCILMHPHASSPWSMTPPCRRLFLLNPKGSHSLSLSRLPPPPISSLFSPTGNRFFPQLATTFTCTSSLCSNVSYILRDSDLQNLIESAIPSPSPAPSPPQRPPTSPSPSSIQPFMACAVQRARTWNAMTNASIWLQAISYGRWAETYFSLYGMC